MSSSSCVVCLAAAEASPESKDALLRWQAIHLDKARAELLPIQVENGRLRDRVRELEETIKRQNKVILKANGRRAS